MRNVALVAFGGALGSAARYGVGVLLASASLASPWATLAVNISGSFVLGALVARYPIASTMPRLLLGVGVCGGFTTFSTFSVETLALIERGQPLRAMGYAVASLALGLLAAVGGLSLGRALGAR